MTEEEDEDLLLLLNVIHRFLRQRSFYKNLPYYSADPFLKMLEADNISVVQKALDVLTDMVSCSVIRTPTYSAEKEDRLNDEHETAVKLWLFESRLYTVLVRVLKKYAGFSNTGYAPILWRTLRLLAFDLLKKVRTSNYVAVQQLVKLLGLMTEKICVLSRSPHVKLRYFACLTMQGIVLHSNRQKANAISQQVFVL